MRPSIGGGVGLHFCGQDSRTLLVRLLVTTKLTLLMGLLFMKLFGFGLS